MPFRHTRLIACSCVVFGLMAQTHLHAQPLPDDDRDLPPLAGDPSDPAPRLDDRPIEEDLGSAGEPQSLGQPMTLARLGQLIRAVDDAAEAIGDQGAWRFTIADVPVQVLTDITHDRMRIMVPVAAAEELDAELMFRLLQANFDTALDARYAVAQGVVWGTFIHPLSSLSDDDFLAGVGQTVNIARTFGTTFSSGVLSFGGGDSRGLIERALIEELRRRGDAI